MYDYSKLLGKIRECGKTLEQLSIDIGINMSTLSGKLHNKSEFRQNEMLSICRSLGIDITEIEKYFFCKNTLENERKVV